MSNFIKNGGPPFPCNPSIAKAYYDGMSLRDYFAGQAIKGMMAYFLGNDYDRMAEGSYKIADAMLKEREK